MGKSQFLSKIQEIVGGETLTGAEELKQLPGWNSLAALAYMALVDELFEVTLSGDELSRCITVDDLVALVGGRVVAC